MATLNVKNFPDDLYEKLRARADHERRSVAQQVIHLLETALEEREAISLLELRGLGKDIWADVDAGEHVAAERDSWT